MCGLAGVWAEPAGALELEARAGAMVAALTHRGPDDQGTWSDAAAGVALGHRRLSILDLSPHGHQPMSSASGRWVIAYNGEIYNHERLRDQLAGEGRAPPWRGHSDTEIMLAAFEAWGVPGTLAKLVGMFAFALWDRNERALWLARDRLGEKPLYYGRVGRDIAFGSELKALRAVPGWRAEIDRDALALFMRYNNVPAPHSIYQGVRKLPAGTYLRIDAREAELPEPQVYWSARDETLAGIARPLELAPAEAVDLLETRLRETLRGQMVADVPLGAFLSGGIDSSTIVALMQSIASRPVRTFTIGFHEPAYNEAEQAAAVARHIGTDHTELYVTAEEAMAVVPRLPALYDEPFADSSQVPTFLVAQLARRQVTVTLSGDGGDELFGGYNRYTFGARLGRRLGAVPRPVRRLASAGLRTLSAPGWDRLLAAAGPLVPFALRQRLAGEKLHKLAAVLTLDRPRDIYSLLVSHWSDPGALVIGGREPAVLDRPDRRLDGADVVRAMMLLDTMQYLPDDILVKVDRATMGVGLEARAPFLDHRVFELAQRLPADMRLRNGLSKWLLRQVLYRYVPAALVDRPKMGFGIPIDQWLRGPLRPWAEDLIEPARLRRQGFLRPEPVHEAWRSHLSGRANLQYPLWCVLMFQAWLDAERR